jgi:hypothetical protein
MSHHLKPHEKAAKDFRGSIAMSRLLKPFGGPVITITFSAIILALGFQNCTPFGSLGIDSTNLSSLADNANSSEEDLGTVCAESPHLFECVQTPSTDTPTPSPSPTPTPLAEPTVPLEPMIALYQYYSPEAENTILVTNPAEMFGNNRYFFEKIAMMIYENPRGTSRAPLYRCYWASKEDHFISLDKNCESTTTDTYKNEGLYGYIEKSEGAYGRRALVRCYHTVKRDHSTAFATQECLDRGYLAEGIVGWVP